MNTGQSLRQTQQQKQVQTTSAVQVMLSKIMEMPLADFEQYVANEKEDNEALEDNVSEYEGDAYDEVAFPGDELGVRDSHTTQDDYGEFLTIDQVPEDMRDRYNSELRIGNASRSQYDGDTERVVADTSMTSYDDILRQIGENDLTDEEVTVMTYLVGSLDEQGYLTKDDQTLADELLFQEHIDIDVPHLQQLISLLQTFEPRGIGARDTRECLLLQMECDPEDRPRLPLVKRLAHKVVRDYYEELTHARWDKIQDALDVNDETIKEIQVAIRRLNPRPGYGLGETIQSSAPTIIADFHVYVDDCGGISVSQERGSVPELMVSPSFAETVQQFRQAQERARKEGRELVLSRSQENEFNYCLHKVDAARTFIESVRRRRQTLQRVMEGIVRYQRDFFLNDDDESFIRPMLLRDIAEYAEVDISTVSRAVNSKFVQTAFGSYPLKFFFGSEFVNADGDSVSQRLALRAIKDIIEGEDPKHPLSDQRITDILAESGTVIARRTVAKYRERLGFPVSTMRRK